MEGTKTLNQALSTLTQHELLFLGQTRRATQRDAPKIRSCGVGLGESRGDSAGALLADALAAPASSQASKSNPTRLRLRLTQRASTWPGSCSYSSCFLGFFQPCCIGSGRACMDSRGPATRMERFMVLGRISKNWERLDLRKIVVSVTRPPEPLRGDSDWCQQLYRCRTSALGLSCSSRTAPWSIKKASRSSSCRAPCLAVLPTEGSCSRAIASWAC